MSEYGSICDGGSHPLSSVYSTLAAAQTVYSFVTSLTQQIDYAALQKASNTAFGAPGSEHGTSNPQLNSTVYLPNGKCMLGNDTWHIAKSDGIRIAGVATTATQLLGNWIVLQFDGLWYSTIENFTVSANQAAAQSTVNISIASPAVVSTWTGPQLEANDPITFSTTGTLPSGITAGTTYYVLSTGLTATSFQFSTSQGGSAVATSGSQSGTQTVTAPVPAVLDVDGNALGAGTTFGVQATNFNGLLVGGGPSPGATTVVAVCRRGGGGGQCSEMTWQNLHVNTCNFACYYQTGFNAIDNVFVGGDMQSYQTNGFYLSAGSFKIYGMSFEPAGGGGSQALYTQIINNGCDVTANSATAGDVIVMSGTRTEGLCIYNGGAQTAALEGVQQAGVIGNWGPGTYALNQLVRGVSTDGQPRAFRVTTAGTSAGSPPTWPTSGTVSDGGVVWTYFPYNVVYASGNTPGRIDLQNSNFMDTAAIKNGGVAGTSNCGTGQSSNQGANSADLGSNASGGSVTEGSGATGCTIVLYPFPQFQASGFDNPNLGAHPPAPIVPTCVVTSPTGQAITSYSVTYSSGYQWNLTWNHVSANNQKFVWSCKQF